MSKTQRIVILLGVILFALSELFPPWIYEDENTSGVRSAGYHFFNNPPKLKSPAEMKEIFSLRDETPQFIWVHEDKTRVYGQRFILIFLTVGILQILFNRRAILNLVSGGIFLCMGLGVLVLYFWYISIYWQ